MPNAGLENYLPDKTSKAYRINAEFILTVVIKIESQYFKALLYHALDAIHLIVEPGDRVDVLTITQTLNDALFAIPFKSCK